MCAKTCFLNKLKNAKDNQLVETTEKKEEKEKKQASNEALKIAEKNFADLIDTDAGAYLWTGSHYQAICDKELTNRLSYLLEDQEKFSKKLVDDTKGLLLFRKYAGKDMNIFGKEAIPVKNGFLKWHEDEQKYILEQHDKKYLNTYVLPLNYDESADCPAFKHYLTTIFAGESDEEQKKECLLQAIGYSLVRSTDFEKFFLLYGAPGSGKSTIIEVIRALAGGSSKEKCWTSIGLDMLSDDKARANLHGKLVNLVSELPRNGSIAENWVKSIVSGDSIPARPIYKAGFDFQPFCTIWIASNSFPKMREYSEAIGQRIIILSFNHSFRGTESCDESLKDKLLSELPGIFNYVLDAYTKARQRDEKGKLKGITMPASACEYYQKWSLAMNPIKGFLDDCCVDDEDSYLPESTLYADYREWLTAVEGGVNPMNRKNFYEILVSMSASYQQKRTAAGRLIRGLRVTKSLDGTKRRFDDTASTAEHEAAERLTAQAREDRKLKNEAAERQEKEEKLQKNMENKAKKLNLSKDQTDFFAEIVNGMSVDEAV